VSRPPAADPALPEAIDAFLLELRVERGLSPLTIAAYRRDLGQFAATADRAWRDDPGPLTAFVADLQARGTKASTQARKSAAIRSFYGWALREGLVTRDVPALVDAPRPGSYLPDVLAPDEVARILDAPPADAGDGIRDRAILELLYGCGLRVSELVGLDVERVDLPNQQLRVIGKGNKERRVPMGDEARERLHRWRSGPRSEWTAERPTAAEFVNRRGRRSRGSPSGDSCGAGRASPGSRSGSRRTRSGTASRRICSRAAPICAWSRRSLAMLASAPPSSTRT
jgi:site-specific recombinase XerD